ncbi:MAG: CvpA family protein [Verrucomicrobiia bacterium]
MNWYDCVVLAALVYGIWSGVITGFSGEIIRVLGLLLMVALALHFYIPAGKWLQGVTGLVEEPANLIAFVAIAVPVYLISLLVRLLVHRRMKKMQFTAAVEDIGGGVAGLLPMVVIMAWLSVILMLTRSPFWHEEIARNSRFGAFVVRQFPAVAAMAEKQFPEKMWFLKDLKRREEPNVEDGSAGK